MSRTSHERSEGAPPRIASNPQPKHPDPPKAPPGASGAALFGALRKAGVDEATAYTAAREMEFTADRSVATRIDAQMDVFGARMEAAHAQLAVQFQAALQEAVRDLKTELKAEFKADLAEVRAEFKADLAEVKAELAEVKTNLAAVTADVAALKREVRLIWGCLSLLVVTLTAVLIRLFAT